MSLNRKMKKRQRQISELTMEITERWGKVVSKKRAMRIRKFIATTAECLSQLRLLLPVGIADDDVRECDREFGDDTDVPTDSVESHHAQRGKRPVPAGAGL